jgi:hypothetical protein
VGRLYHHKNYTQNLEYLHSQCAGIPNSLIDKGTGVGGKKRHRAWGSDVEIESWQASRVLNDSSLDISGVHPSLDTSLIQKNGENCRPSPKEPSGMILIENERGVTDRHPNHLDKDNVNYKSDCRTQCFNFSK